MSDWKSLLRERFATKDGRIEELHILQGPTCPGVFYAGPVPAHSSSSSLDPHNGSNIRGDQ